MPKVTFLPLEQTFDAQPGDSILDVALNNDVPMQHACGGFCACATCHIHVIAGADSLTPKEGDEDDRLGTADRVDATSRLGCQSRIGQSDVTVEILNLDH